MSEISADTFVMGMRSDARAGYIDITFRDVSSKRRLRKFDMVYNIRKNKWIIVKAWTTALPGESHYISLPMKMRGAIIVAANRALLI